MIIDCGMTLVNTDKVEYFRLDPVTGAPYVRFESGTEVDLSGVTLNDILDQVNHTDKKGGNGA